MKSTDLRKEIILEFNEVEQNQFDSRLSITRNIINKASKDLDLIITRNPNRKMTNIYYQKKKIGYLRGLKVGTTSSEAFNICRDKFKLENYLARMNISTLTSLVFEEDEKNEAFEYIKNNRDFTYVLKPLSLAGGHGIELDVSPDNFPLLWDQSMKAQKFRKVKRPACIVQPFIKGFDVRVSVIEGQYSSAILRLPAHIIGDGTKTIKELVDEKNSNRLNISYFKNKLIPIDKKFENRLFRNNYTFDTILNDKEVLLLSDISNLTLGGESIDITNDLSEEIKEIAIHSVASIPGMYTGGVDLMTEDYKGKTGYIIEVNTNANHTMHHLPLKGDVTEPFYDLLENLLIRHKVKSGIELTSVNREKYKEIYAFDMLKQSYNNKLFNLIDI